MQNKSLWRMVACTVSLPVRLIDYGLRDYNVDGQIGLEQTPDEYVADLVQVFREVWRVLRDDGTVWLNLGDSYSGSGNGSNDYRESGASISKNDNKYGSHKPVPIRGLKSKDLIGIPWMVAFALRADGWYLRQDIIWAKACSGNIRKGSAMPESVTDRFQKSHEYIFLLSKSPRYYFDNEAVKEKCVTPADMQVAKRAKSAHKGQRDPGGRRQTTAGFDKINKVYEFGNRRSVWFVNPKPYKGAHFATYPPELIEPMILAGCPQIVCAKCGAPYQRVLERADKRHWTERNDYKSGDKYKFEYLESKQSNDIGRNDAPASFKSPEMIDKGFQPTCNCNAGTTSGIVLDPFVGSGTTVMVANQLGRRGFGLDLSFKYLHEDAKKRIEAVQPKIFA